MPPRPRQGDIVFAVQTDGVTPVMPANFDKHCPVVVSRSAYRWRSLLPFLPWVDEVVAPGSLPSSATISYFELESLLLIVLDFRPGAEDKQPIDTYFKLDFMARVLRPIAMSNIINVPIKDEAAFYATVYPYDHCAGFELAREQLSSGDSRRVTKLHPSRYSIHRRS